MIRIDVDNYVILYLQYEDQMHRYAVPHQWTVSILAAHLIDSFDKEKPIQLRRKAETKYKVFDEAGVSIPLITIVEVFHDGDALLIKIEELAKNT